MWKNDEFPARDAFEEFWDEAMLCVSGDVEELISYKHTLYTVVAYLDEHPDFKFHGGEVDVLRDGVTDALCEIVIMGRTGEVDDSRAWEDFMTLCIERTIKSGRF